LTRHVNDRWQDWAEMWREEVRLGLTPYYFFIARNTGPRSYFEVPLAESLRIFSKAYGRVSGLGRTVRGPVMSATPGKVLIVGVTSINHQKVFVLKMIQGRDPEWVNRVFFARFDPWATWFDQLEPVFGDWDSPFGSSLPMSGEAL
jgi:L-lysine 2,3-aminomutase